MSDTALRTRGTVAPRTGTMPASRGDAVHRAVWRWHFQAGLLCLPFLVLLSATGALYLFKAEIERTAFAGRTVVTPGATRVSPGRLLFAASEAAPEAMPVSLVDPVEPTASAVVTLSEGGRRIRVYLNPYTGDVLDRTTTDGEFLAVVRRLHSLALLGPVANGVIEAVAGFAVILVSTGTYLWWPRGRGGGVVTVRARPASRVWWRDLHAVTGLVAGAGLLFLALTGLPWSIVWGAQVRAWSNEAGLGQPRALWADRAVSTMPMRERLSEAGWTMQDAPVPLSRAPAPGVEGLGIEGIGIDRAVERLRELDMPPGFEVSLPVGDTGVYAAAAYPRDVTRQRMISLDQYSGAALVDVRFSDLGPVGRAIQYGIGIHKGEHWGRANQLAMLAICLATILLCVTATTMWWKRRPAGGLGVPARPHDRRTLVGVTGLVLGLGALFPLTGLAILAMLALDLGVQALRPRLAR